jgi:multicomponent K+:H+ antiporter subunit E
MKKEDVERGVSPVMKVALAVLWLLLNQSVSPGNIVLGLLLGALLAWAASSLRPLQARVRRLDLALVLAIVVLGDIVRSNVAVAGIVLGLVRRRDLHSGFVDIPLELRDPHGLAGLAAIVTSTPGTVWVGLSRDGSVLTLHVLDLRDESAWVRLIKERYERPLRRIFE